MLYPIELWVRLSIVLRSSTILGKAHRIRISRDVHLHLGNKLIPKWRLETTARWVVRWRLLIILVLACWKHVARTHPQPTPRPIALSPTWIRGTISNPTSIAIPTVAIPTVAIPTVAIPTVAIGGELCSFRFR